jgi:DNA processing protein
MENKLLLRAVIADMTFLKIREKLLLENEVNSIQELGLLESADIARLIKRDITASPPQRIFVEKRAQEIAHLMSAYEIKAVHIDESAYPALLKEIYDPPFMLFYRGNIDALYARCVSVVGTRNPTRYAAEAAFEFAKDASQEGFTVVSGLALGIDAFAHKGSLSSGGTMATCAVLASGVDEISPFSNKPVARVLLAKGGCVVSEYAPGTHAAKWHFPARNRIISGLSSATLIVDAPEKSGALITADFALEQGRDVFFHRAALKRFQDDGQNEHAAAIIDEKVLRDARAYIQAGAPIIDSFEDFLKQHTTNEFTNCAFAAAQYDAGDTLDLFNNSVSC